MAITTPLHAGHPLPRERSILCLGDSLTAGFGVPVDAAYPALLQGILNQRRIPYRVINAGVSGDTTAGALRRLSWVLRLDPEIAIVTLGANDGLRGLDLTRTEDNLGQIIKRLQEKKVRVILGGMRLPPNYGEHYSRAFADLYPRLAARHGIPLIPFFLEGVAGNSALNLDDGIHPNAEGYALVVKNVWKILEPVLVEMHPSP